MAELPYMPTQVADAIVDASDLSNEELGAWQRLMWALWRGGGYVEEDRLSKVCHGGSRWWRLKRPILARLTCAGGLVSYPPLLVSLALTLARRKQRSDAAHTRWSRRKSLKGLEATHASASPPHMRSTCNQNQNIERGEPFFTEPSTASNGDKDAQRASEEVGQELYYFGTELLMERSGLTRHQARGAISRWLVSMGTDADGLATILAAAENENLTGRAFENHVDQVVRAKARERVHGLSLPLGPILIKRSA